MGRVLFSQLKHDISCISEKERPPPRVQKHRYSLNELRRTLWPLPIMGERREKNSLQRACDVRGRYSILMAALAAGELPAVVVLLYYNVRRGKERGERGMFKLRNRSLARRSPSKPNADHSQAADVGIRTARESVRRRRSQLSNKCLGRRRLWSPVECPRRLASVPPPPFSPLQWR